jgi:hypothetical protein
LRGLAWPVRLYAGLIALAHRNKAVPDRHMTDLDVVDRARLDTAFAPCLDRMGYPRVTACAP